MYGVRTNSTNSSSNNNNTKSSSSSSIRSSSGRSSSNKVTNGLIKNKNVGSAESGAAKKPQPQQGYASRKPSSLPTSNVAATRPSLVSKQHQQQQQQQQQQQRSNTITTGVFRPAPPVPARSRVFKEQKHHLDLRFNNPPSRMEGCCSTDSTSPAAAAFHVADTAPAVADSPAVNDVAPVCNDPSSHPGSTTIPRPVNQFFLQKSWIKGPSDASGTVVSLSDRPSLCMSVHGTELAVGSSDHAVYTIDVVECKLTRIMHGKSYGHTEWVTCIDHLQDGRIISGGMDNKLCLWDRRGVRSRDLKGHSASISAVKAGLFNSIAVSASYDRSLILWDVGGPSGKELGRLEGHKAAVMDFTTSSRGRLVSGCRDGTVILWDVKTRSPVLQCKNAHKGHVTALESLEDNSAEIFLTGGQDGVLQVWDFRVKRPVHTVTLHRSTKGIGALSCIATTKKTTCGCPVVTTAGADRLLKVLDVRASCKVIHTLEDHRDFIYSLYMNASLAWSGGGDGSLLVHDVVSGKCLYGLGATKNGAVRGISLAGEEEEKLVVTGDDGNVMIYSL